MIRASSACGGSASAEPRAAAETQAAALRLTRLEHAMETAQDYVEAIAGLSATDGEARAVDLARRLGVSHVTVIRTVARLQRDGYLSTRPYRSIFLTEKGSQARRRIAAAARDRGGISSGTGRAGGNGADGRRRHRTSRQPGDFGRVQTARRAARLRGRVEHGKRDAIDTRLWLKNLSLCRYDYPELRSSDENNSTTYSVAIDMGGNVTGPNERQLVAENRL